MIMIRALILLTLLLPTAALSQTAPEPNWGIVIHGGAGTIERGSMTPEMEAQCRERLAAALRAGHDVLEGGGSSLDAVQAAITVMEDSPLFNAGKGAVFTHEGKNELDAAIMDGATRRAGAVARLRHVRNPIQLARAVMERSPHVMLVGDGAEEFALEQGIPLVPESYFYTEARWRSLQRAIEEEKRARGGAPTAMTEDLWNARTRKFGTVGAVALDRHGNLAAGTSTGGLTDKRWGRVGDSPIIGAGTYADNRCQGSSATGTGEYFIRAVVGHDICALMMYRGLSLKDAAEEVVMKELVAMGGDGGVIAMDRSGNYVTTFNTSGMYRGYMGKDGRAVVGIYKD
jgi:beta-aspartyl-peptidase (threonine type)